MSTYLLIYNYLAAFGWAIILFKVIVSILSDETGLELWANTGATFSLVVTCSIFEILHSLSGLVRSPLLPTTIDVLSRLLFVWVYMMPTSGSSGGWSLYLCIGPWAVAQLPRYIYYIALLNVRREMHKVNYQLFWLRYNMFIVLTPVALVSEAVLMYYAYGGLSNATLFKRFTLMHHLFYVPVGPLMVLYMWYNGAAAYRKRHASANPRPLKGVVWPVTDFTSQRRSSTRTNKAIWAGSITAIDKAMADRCLKSGNWRFGYNKYVMDNVDLSCRTPKNALAIAAAGLDKAYLAFEFKRDKESVSFQQALTKGYYKGSFGTHVIKGTGASVTELRVPYSGGPTKYQVRTPYFTHKNKHQVISGDELVEQLRTWVALGTIEQSAADAISLVSQNSEWLDLSGHYFILLGATSAMGPLTFLLQHGANVIAVDLNRDFIWHKLFAAVNNSSGTLIFPVPIDADVSSLNQDQLAKISGCDLLVDTPEIANWLADVIRTKVQGKPLTIGNYTYLDGALHVQLALACDGLIKRVCEERKDAMIAFLCTPTDNHVIPSEVYRDAKQSYDDRTPMFAWLLNTILFGKLIAPNWKCVRPVIQTSAYGSREPLYIIDGIVVAQGPNYALAKRLQHWRAILAHANGHVVSSNVAPSTATESVLHNSNFAAAYGSMHHFQPMEILYPRTSVAVMGALLVHDIRNVEGPANPESKIAKSFRNPYQLFSFGAFHGGIWRGAYRFNDVGLPSALAFYITKYRRPIVVGGLNFFVFIQCSVFLLKNKLVVE